MRSQLIALILGEPEAQQHMHCHHPEILMTEICTNLLYPCNADMVILLCSVATLFWM